MERASKTVHTSGERKIGIREGATNEVSGVSADITTFMITIKRLGLEK